MIAAISGSVSNKDFSRAYIVMSTVMSVMTPIAAKLTSLCAWERAYVGWVVEAIFTVDSILLDLKKMIVKGRSSKSLGFNFEMV